jgi:hypothetical protein
METKHLILASVFAAVSAIAVYGCWMDKQENVQKIDNAAAVANAAAESGLGGVYALAVSAGLNLLQAVAHWRQRSKGKETEAAKELAYKAFGAVSRALDESCSGEAGGLVQKQIQDTPGLTSETMKDLHALAKDKEI